MSALETPDDYYRYFQGLVEIDPTNTKWRAGYVGATLWRDYFRAPPPDRLACLNAVIKQLMPHRWAGSGFHAFWLTILQHLRTLPPALQAPLFLTIFDPANHGDQSIEWSRQAQLVVQHWCSAIDTPALDQTTFQRLADLSYLYFASSIEWFTLVTALDIWIKTVRFDYDFIQELGSRYNQQKES